MLRAANHFTKTDWDLYDVSTFCFFLCVLFIPVSVDPCVSSPHAVSLYFCIYGSGLPGTCRTLPITGKHYLPVAWSKSEETASIPLNWSNVPISEGATQRSCFLFQFIACGLSVVNTSCFYPLILLKTTLISLKTKLMCNFLFFFVIWSWKLL